jgi:hypothetical protein
MMAVTERHPSLNITSWDLFKNIYSDTAYMCGRGGVIMCIRHVNSYNDVETGELHRFYLIYYLSTLSTGKYLQYILYFWFLEDKITVIIFSRPVSVPLHYLLKKFHIKRLSLNKKIICWVVLLVLYCSTVFTQVQ